MYDIIDGVIGHPWNTNAYSSSEQQIIYYIAGTVIILFFVIIVDLFYRLVRSAFGKRH